VYERLAEREQKATGTDKPTTSTNKTGPEKTQEPPKKRARKSAPDDDDSQIAAAITKALTTECISLLKQVRDIDREHHFYETLVSVQTSEIPPCQNCQGAINDKEDLNILKSCGHILCTACSVLAKKAKSCVLEGCDGHVLPSKIVPGVILINEDQAIESSKLTKLVEIIQSIPQDELALIFVQSGHLMPVASDALRAAKIDHRIVTSNSLKVISQFTDIPKLKKGQTELPPRPKALILNLGGAMAAGL
jgi:hypothetical protein